MSAAGQLAHLLVVSVGSLVPWRSARARDPPTRVAVLGGGFAGLTAARTLAATPGLEVLLVDQREYFEYTPGILRAWVDTRAHAGLVNPIRRLLRGPRASFQRVPPGYVATLEYRSESANGEAVERPPSLRERRPCYAQVVLRLRVDRFLLTSTIFFYFNFFIFHILSFIHITCIINI